MSNLDGLLYIFCMGAVAGWFVNTLVRGIIAIFKS
jgi:hypothetical protein